MANQKHFPFPTRRRLIQLYAALLSNAHLKGFLKGEIYTGELKNLCVPGLNCYSCPGAVGACPLGALQNALASSDKKAPYFMFGILLLLGLIAGRTICGYLCPFGLIQELLDKIRTPKLKKNRVTHALSYLKYGILAVFVIGIPLYYALQSLPVPGFCKYICPAGTLEGAMGLLINPVNEPKLSMLNLLFTRKFILLVLILLACLFIYRAFCRFLCPLGAIYGFFSRISLLGVKVEADQCINCGKCIAHCKMDIRHVGDHECIQCGDCIPVCPTKAISYKLTKIKPAEDGKKTDQRKWKEILIILSAWILLAGVLYVVNRPEIVPSSNPDSTEETADSHGEDGSLEEESRPQESNAADNHTAEESGLNDTIPVGKEVGERCPSFTAPLYLSEEIFDLNSTRGKVTIINFWATWCTPCCAELPYFQEIYEKYPDQVCVAALHSNLVTDDVTAYLQKFDYTLDFALDETGEIIRSLGGSTMLPMTVILDQKGVIVYNAVGSMTYEKLEEQILPLLSKD